jgi:hypothetical protein
MKYKLQAGVPAKPKRKFIIKNKKGKVVARIYSEDILLLIMSKEYAGCFSILARRENKN